MANKEIRDYDDYTGADNDGYVIIGGKEGITGGKKLLSSIGGGGYNFVSLTPTEPTSSETYSMTAANKTFYLMDFTKIGAFETFNVTIPSVEEGEFLDILIQIKPNSDDYKILVKNSIGQVLPRLDLSDSIYYYQDVWVQVRILGECYTIAYENSDAS